MDFDNEMSHPNSGTVSNPQKKQKDHFKNADAHTTRVLLPDNLGVLEANGKRVNVPTQLTGSLLIKALYYLIHHTGLSPITQINYIGCIERVFGYMAAHQSAYAVKDPKFIMQVVSNAIKDMDMIDKTAHNHQRIFFNAIRKVKDDHHFTTGEQKLVKAILKHAVVFDAIKSYPKKTVSELYPELIFSDRQYIESIRTIAFSYHAIWSDIRSQFKSQMPSEYAELKERLLKSPGLVELVSPSTPALSVFRKGNTHCGSPLKDDVIWIRQLFLRVATTLKNDYFTEALFLSMAYGQVRFKARYLDQQHDRLALQSKIDHSTMLDLVSKWLLQIAIKFGGKVAIIPAVFSPLCLLLPWGGNELGLYAAFLLTDRVGPASIRSISLKQLTWLDRNHVHTTQALASRATIRGIYKGRQNKTTDLDITDRTKPTFHLLSELYSSYNTAIEERIIKASFMKPFEQLFSTGGHAVSSQLLGQGLSKLKITYSGLTPLVVKGSALYAKIESLNVPAFHELMIAGSQRLSSKKGDRLNTNLPKWRLTQAFVAPTAITQSRVIADQALDLNDVRISEDMTLSYSEEFYTQTQQKADAQFHSIETRLNVYYQRANAKLVVVHIPAHHEHPFRTNVNTYSGLT